MKAMTENISLEFYLKLCKKIDTTHVHVNKLLWAQHMWNDQILILKDKFKTHCDMTPVPTKVFSDSRNSLFHDTY